MHEVAVVSNGITFKQNLIKISHVAQNMKEGTQNQYSNLISPLSFLEKGKWIRDYNFEHLSQQKLLPPSLPCNSIRHKIINNTNHRQNRLRIQTTFKLGFTLNNEYK